jgi:hypothetical protein
MGGAPQNQQLNMCIIAHCQTHHDDVGVFWQGLGDLYGSPNSVRRLEGGNDTLELGA